MYYKVPFGTVNLVLITVNKSLLKELKSPLKYIASFVEPLTV